MCATAILVFLYDSILKYHNKIIVIVIIFFPQKLEWLWDHHKFRWNAYSRVATLYHITLHKQASAHFEDFQEKKNPQKKPQKINKKTCLNSARICPFDHGFIDICMGIYSRILYFTAPDKTVFKNRYHIYIWLKKNKHTNNNNNNNKQEGHDGPVTLTWAT